MFTRAHPGSALVWDNNETPGALGLRALAHPDANRIVWDLLADVDHFQTVKARIGELAAYTRPQGEARFDILASDGDPARMAQVDAVEFRRIGEVLARFYGHRRRHRRQRPRQQLAGRCRRPHRGVHLQADTAEGAGWVLDHLRSTGRGRLADQAVTVLSAARPATHPPGPAGADRALRPVTRVVVHIPYDPVIATGQEMNLFALHRRTREAWLADTAAASTGCPSARRPAVMHDSPHLEITGSGSRWRLQAHGQPQRRVHGAQLRVGQLSDEVAQPFGVHRGGLFSQYPRRVARHDHLRAKRSGPR